MPTKIFVGNLSDSAKTRDLRVQFERFGKVVECDILKNFAFVHMDGEDDAKDAIAALDGQNFAGSRITVEISHGKRRRDGGGGGGGGRGGRGGRGRRDFGPPRGRYSGRDSYDRSNSRYGSSSSSRYDDRRGAPPSRDSYRDRSPYEGRSSDYYSSSRRSPVGRSSHYDSYESSSRSRYGHGRSPPPRSSRNAPY